jgi:hypothetical protein
MFLAMAVLLIHPQLAANLSLSADKAAIDATAADAVSSISVSAEYPLPLATVSLNAAAQPTVESSEELPEAPLPLTPATPAEPVAFVRPTKPFTVSVSELRAENRQKQLMWKGLVIASSGAATFDAWSTRRAITHYGAQELDPLLKPFAGNASLYAAIQVGPVLMDFLGRKMMYSRHSWVRHMWWAPQSASFVSSIFCGSHNLAYH